MMRTISRSIRVLLAAVAALAMCLAFSASTASASPTASATWHLSDEEQRYCVPEDRPHRYYVFAFVSGSWDAPLTVELQGLPEGGNAYSYAEPTPPGDNGSEYLAVDGFFVTLPGLEYGEHHATVHVTDGTVSQTTPIVFDARDKDTWSWWDAC
jgi:hypothetical protein